ncbi:unnamed protein product, partial [Meganyctiphanes norvegica]
QRSLAHCCVIEGDLQLLLLEKHDSWDKVKFPRLVEITGFLLVYRVYNIQSLGSLFPNLATIRGLTTHQGYSLVLYDNRDLQEVGLYRLASILNGYVRIQNNIQLCFGDDKTINWNRICKAEDSGKRNHFSAKSRLLTLWCSQRCRDASKFARLNFSEICVHELPPPLECSRDKCSGG